MVNPHVKFRFIRDATGIATIKVEAPTKDQGLRVTSLDRAADTGLFTFLLLYSASPAAAEAMVASLSDDEQRQLTDMGFLVRDEQVATPVFFECEAGDPPRPLLPERARATLARPPHAGRGLTIDPTLKMFGEGGPPKEMRGRYDLANPFRSGRVWFSVDGDLAVPCFCSCEGDVASSLTALAAGHVRPDDLSDTVRAQLASAGVLRTPADIEARRQQRTQAVTAAHQTLTGERYIVLSEVIRPEQIAAIRRYYRALIDEGFVRYGDAEWPNRYFAAMEPLTHFFQAQLTGVISEIAGEPLKPSFSFFTSYHPGSDLPAHRDREQCYLAMTLLLDHGQTDDFSAWPIYVQATETSPKVPIHSGLGDGLLYFGEEVLHWRDALTQGYSTHWFLFWVPERFSGSLE